MSAVLTATGVGKSFHATRLDGFWPRRSSIRAVAGVDLDIHRGECLALIGESGSGKSTLARCLAGLLDSDEGRIVLDGQDFADLGGRSLRRARRLIQLMFQDPQGALDPRYTVAATLDEALRAVEPGRCDLAQDRHRLLREVGLEPSHGKRYPHQLSGGQRQRVTLARALAAEPRVLVLDEPTSGLDASLRHQILELLEDLRRRRGTAQILISHDLEVASTADRLAVMYLGHLVEIGEAGAVLRSPRHPYTAALLASRPTTAPDAAPWVAMRGEIPSAENPPSGCVFHPRCASADARCSTEKPELESAGERRAACFHPLVATAADLPSSENRRSHQAPTTGNI